MRGSDSLASLILTLISQVDLNALRLLSADTDLQTGIIPFHHGPILCLAVTALLSFIFDIFWNLLSVQRCLAADYGASRTLLRKEQAVSLLQCYSMPLSNL